MVRQYPPDWSQAAVLPIDTGGSRVTTLLGVDKPATTVTDSAIAVVRTIVIDMDSNNDVTASRLVEFISPDPLEPDRFTDYVKQWADDNFSDTKVLAAEYSIGYAPQKATIHAPGESSRPTSVYLRAGSGMGKTQATWYCFVTDVDVTWLCKWDPDTGVFYDCVPHEYTIDITCIEIDDIDFDGGGGGGGGDGDCATTNSCGGGGGGDGGNGGDDDHDGVFFSLNCTPSTVTRGSTAGCTVEVSSDDDPTVSADQYVYTWASGTGATPDGHVTTSWKGVATETTTITVSVISEGFTATKTITVSPRSGWGVDQLNASPQYDTDLPYLGLYEIPRHPPPIGTIIDGSGPWDGQHMTGTAPVISSHLWISGDYSDNQGKSYPGAGNTCSGYGLSDIASYYSVNTECGTDPAWRAFEDKIVVHEYEHEAGLDACLSGRTGSMAMSNMEAIVGSYSEVRSSYRRTWTTFYDGPFQSSGYQATAPTIGTSFWLHTLSQWALGHPISFNETGNFGC